MECVCDSESVSDKDMLLTEGINSVMVAVLVTVISLLKDGVQDDDMESESVLVFCCDVVCEELHESDMSSVTEKDCVLAFVSVREEEKASVSVWDMVFWMVKVTEGESE